MSKTITITLRDTVVDNFEQFATLQKRTLEEIVTETLVSHQPETELLEQRLAFLNAYTDDQLWQVVNQQIIPEQQERLEDLAYRVNAGELLTYEEERERLALVDLVMWQMLQRSRALALLKAHGHSAKYF